MSILVSLLVLILVVGVALAFVALVGALVPMTLRAEAILNAGVAFLVLIVALLWALNLGGYAHLRLL